MTVEDRIARVRPVADAVLYEGYLLYPYRSNSAKNRMRWQFGVLGPPGAADGEAPELAAAVPARPAGPAPRVSLRLRFLQLQERRVERRDGAGWVRADSLEHAGRTWVSWDEAVEREVPLGPLPLAAGVTATPFRVPGGKEAEPLGHAARVLRRRRPLDGLLTVTAQDAGGGVLRLGLAARNTTPGLFFGREAATAASFLGAHVVLVAEDAELGSVTDPPAWAAVAAAGCEQHRCWPVLGGDEGDADLVLASPIILYDHPAIAPESAGSLFDATEIDEILTLRVMTMTDEEKADARATDPLAAAIVDRCDELAPADLDRLHGARRDPDGRPGRDDPGDGFVLVAGVRVSRGSLVRLRPGRRADAQDIFLRGMEARVTTVLDDVDGGTHVGVVLADDPAADLHEWYGRYLYFAPDELEPVRAEEEEEPS